MSLVQAQNETPPQPQAPQPSQGNQTSNNSSYQIPPGALIYPPPYKPCKDNPGVLCSVYPKLQPIPPNKTILPSS
jgi:hypothetical protein